MLKGIDVSTHQGVIDWEKVKPQIDFAILRCGFGDDIAAQDDKQYERNVSECERLGIPYGVYLYSYADTYEHIHSEVAHVLRLLQGKKPFCVYIDMEDGSTKKCGKATLTDFVKVFCEGVKAQGYKVGVYASKYWCCSFLDIALLSACGYSVWCAQYATVEPKIDAAFDIWQYSSSGKVDGIRGNVDMNYMYKDIRFLSKAPEEETETPKEDVVLEWQKAAIADGYQFPRYGADGMWGGECVAVAQKAVCKKLLVGYKNKNLTRIIQREVGVAVDGLFGTNTRKAVVAYQKAHGLAADGCVGVNTWRVMLGVK